MAATTPITASCFPNPAALIGVRRPVVEQVRGGGILLALQPGARCATRRAVKMITPSTREGARSRDALDYTSLVWVAMVG
jgi:hypothetical protein